tara:strand:+ start:804 stop:1001 length:198 start_codon:yes stop_codon:yes gene_type:complete
MNKKLIGQLFGQNLFIESDITDIHQREIVEQQIGKWLSEADFAKRQLDYIKSMTDLEKQIFYKNE